MARVIGFDRRTDVSDRGGEWEIRHALERGIQGYLLLGCRLEEMASGLVALHHGRRHLGQEPARRIAESFDYEALTSREADVLRLVAAGCANKVVAKRLDIALGTEPPRKSWRLQLLRGWSHDNQAQEVFTRGCERGRCRRYSASAAPQDGVVDVHQGSRVAIDGP